MASEYVVATEENVEVNLSPLLDVVFVILILGIVLASFLQIGSLTI